MQQQAAEEVRSSKQQHAGVGSILRSSAFAVRSTPQHFQQEDRPPTFSLSSPPEKGSYIAAKDHECGGNGARAAVAAAAAAVLATALAAACV